MPGYQQGHKNYYEGKKVPYDKFMDVWELYYIKRDISKTKAAKMLGVSTMTFSKWEKMIYLNFGINRNLNFIIF